MDKTSNHQLKRATTSYPSNRILNRLLFLCGPLSQLLYLIFFILADFIPPISPSLPPQEIATHFTFHARGIKAGTYLISFVGIFWPLYGIAIHNQLSRMPNVPGTPLILQLVNSSALGIVFSLIAMFFAAAGYRSDRDPAITQLAHDLAWFCWGFCAGPLALQFLAVAWTISCSSFSASSTVLFPRWVAYTSLVFPAWLLVPFGAHFVHDGPFAWDGALSFWGLWITSVVTFGPVDYFVWRAIDMDSIGEYAAHID
ncbi:hypothetical protein BDV38DRAFT_278536 [Aspergillus pseudotamarii]|uniref:Integral membrane protein n=1 Tax=Aspergillus pseudotamarii TaxID=132259 RepID=A0A5N6T861_ASPPS|nr:uncharacterized protein BDV38DRAFT_278536 [Aspergillus pseudotamarii]KAE8142371.1 hypothetical protein BDV38DRAFT_278536 [Aspergillus pseudotamarii]